MNYILEINAFYEWLDTHALNRSAIALWYALLHIDNKAKWPASFTVAISTLQTKAGLSRSELFVARQQLLDAGRISCKPRDGQLSAIYSIIPFNLTDGESHTRGQGVRDNPRRDAIQNAVEDICQEIGSRGVLVADNGSGEVTNHRINPDVNPDAYPNANRDANHDPNQTQSPPVNKENENSTRPNEGEDKSSVSSADDPAKSIRNIIPEYNRICKNLPKAKMLTKKRVRMLGARLHEHGYEKIIQVFKKARTSDFLAGANKRNWTADFDWLIRPCNFVKVLEGNYENDRFVNHDKSQFVGKPSPIELLEGIYNDIQENGKFNQ